MRAEPAAQIRLLALQEIDSRLAMLAHRRRSLPQHEEIANLQTIRNEYVDAQRDQQIALDDLSRAQSKADADVEQVKARRKKDQDRIDSGAINNPKDLEHMQSELVSLDRRITVLEDEELEVMEQVETAQAGVDELGSKIEGTDRRLTDLIDVRDAAVAEIDAEVEELNAHRGPAAEGIPEDLMALYERLRESKGGVAASELRRRECGGCRLTLDNAELSQIRATDPDQVVRCEECQRILVRTDESGL